MKELLMRIDVHAHCFDREYIDCLNRLMGGTAASHTSRAPGLNLSLDDMVSLLDEAGVDLQVLSASASQPYAAREADAVTAARLCNDIYADAARRYPGRFAGFGSVPLP